MLLVQSQAAVLGQAVPLSDSWVLMSWHSIASSAKTGRLERRHCRVKHIAPVVLVLRAGGGTALLPSQRLQPSLDPFHFHFLFTSHELQVGEHLADGQALLGVRWRLRSQITLQHWQEQQRPVPVALA